MVPPTLTRRQQEIYDYLREHLDEFPHPPTLDELCDALGLKSRGSLHKQIQALIESGLVEPMNNLRRGIRLAEEQMEPTADTDALPLYGYIAAGSPIEAISNPESIDVPSPPLRIRIEQSDVAGRRILRESLRTAKMLVEVTGLPPCYSRIAATTASGGG